MKTRTHTPGNGVPQVKADGRTAKPATRKPPLSPHYHDGDGARQHATRDALRHRARPALDGIRVLDLTNVLAGPFCAYQLGLLGAEVIKLEIPHGGDLARQLGADSSLNKALMGASFLAQNGGKKSVTVNLKSDEGK